MGFDDWLGPGKAINENCDENKEPQFIDACEEPSPIYRNMNDGCDFGITREGALANAPSDTAVNASDFDIVQTVKVGKWLRRKDAPESESSIEAVVCDGPNTNKKVIGPVNKLSETNLDAINSLRRDLDSANKKIKRLEDLVRDLILQDERFDARLRIEEERKHLSFFLV